MIWFSSDFHLGHKNILKYSNRPFQTVEEMDNEILKRWNSVVKPNDQAYYLGDLTLGNYETAASYINKMNGNIKFIEGNHDRSWFKNFDTRFKLPPIFELKINKQLFVLCHYPLSTWLRSYHGSINLHGHCHGNIGRINESEDRVIPTDQKRGKRIDVGVDCWNYFPVSMEEILDFSKS